mmetsp:Transcript_85873/g.152063  ORF Transcript_85873/g.152063 Transcript_85873/m.152063 type:complete len:95 (+) Transcript_85873:682-966(+)
MRKALGRHTAALYHRLQVAEKGDLGVRSPCRAVTTSTTVSKAACMSTAQVPPPPADNAIRLYRSVGPQLHTHMSMQLWARRRVRDSSIVARRQA